MSLSTEEYIAKMKADYAALEQENAALKARLERLSAPVSDEEVYVGDEVVLIGKQGEEEIPLMEIARLCDTIPYEVLCLFNDRIPRLYKGNLPAK